MDTRLDEINQRLKQQYEKNEDYKYIIYLAWLELYLPNFDEFGPFEYPSEDLSIQQKCKELIKFYEDKCGITNINDIMKKRTGRGLK